MEQGLVIMLYTCNTAPLPRIPVCSLEAGFSSFYRRRNILHTFLTKTRRRYVPAFTQQGFAKTRVPEDIYQAGTGWAGVVWLIGGIFRHFCQ